jgi:gamma-glutamyl-gamma-aminobutyrate hydrolase PuuD
MKLYSAYFRSQDPFKIFSETIPVYDPEELATDGALILWGGEDISPALYNQDVIHARASKHPSSRDLIEATLFNAAVKLGIPIIGVCRGAQLACALSGGTLYQHIQGGHHQDHAVSTFDGQTFYTTSCHHQALNLSKVGHELLAWDKDRTTVAYTDKDIVEVTIPEVVLLTESNTLAIQGHPEWMSPTTPFVTWCANQFKERFM